MPGAKAPAKQPDTISVFQSTAAQLAVRQTWQTLTFVFFHGLIILATLLERYTFRTGLRNKGRPDKT